MEPLAIQKKITTGTKRPLKSTDKTSSTANKAKTPSTAVEDHMPAKDDTCTRCGGFMVSHWCMNVNYDAGGMEILTKRCLQCGEVIDPVILENRLNPQREELKKKTRPLLSRPLASSKSKSSGMSCMPLA